MKLSDSRIAAKSALFGCVLAIISATGCSTFENHFIYNPSVYPYGWTEIEDQRIEEAWFSSSDGTQLHGLFVEHGEPKAFLLFAHGRRGNVTSNVDTLIKFAERHEISVMTFDYRGFGRSEGMPDEQGLYDDARAARGWFAQRCEIPEDEIIVMGHSLGAAVAVELAAVDGAKGLIVESGFTSLPKLVRRFAPIVPAELIMNSDFDSIRKIETYTGPTMIAHGTADKIIPIKHGLQLFEAAGGPKQFFKIQGGKHVNEPTRNYQLAIDDFISETNQFRR